MIDGLKPYPKYENFVSPWLGSMPAHWRQHRAKYLFHEVDERSTTGKEELLSVSHLTGVTPRSQKTVTMFLAKSNIGHKVCRPDDVVINTMWAWMGALGVARNTGLVSPSYGVYRPLTNCAVLPHYADYLLRTPLYVAEYQRRSTGVNSSRLRLYPEQFLRIAVVVPPHSEQETIVRFLDHANGRIDRAIRAKKTLIALLNEEKQSIIHRAVTRGLDPSIPLTPSGVPWLGSIPRHWRVSRVKNEFSCLNSRRIPLNSVERGTMTAKLYDYYGASGIIDKVDNYLFDEDLLLIAEDGANLALRNLPLAIIARGRFWVNNHAHILKPKSGSLEYLAGVMETLNFQPWISGAAQPKLTKDRLMAIAIAVAPSSEQALIVEHFVRETAPLRTAVTRTEREIALLREYRTRLTTDVVTGKLDVREAVRNLPDTAEESGAPQEIEELQDVEPEDVEA
jgi:type I restriction enzyme, S subunit